MESQITYVYLPGVSRSQIKKIRLLRDGTELKIVEDWITTNYPELVFVSLGASPFCRIRSIRSSRWSCWRRELRFHCSI